MGSEYQLTRLAIASGETSIVQMRPRCSPIFCEAVIAGRMRRFGVSVPTEMNSKMSRLHNPAKSDRCPELLGSILLVKP